MVWVAIAQQGQCRLVGQRNAVMGVYHQHAGAHAPDDQLVDFIQIGDLRAAFFGQDLIAAGARGDLFADEGHRDVAGGEHRQFRHRSRGAAAFQQGPQVLQHDGRAGEHRDAHAVAQPQQDRGGRHVEQQHHRNAGAGARQGVCGQGCGQDVGDHGAQHGGGEPALAAPPEQQRNRHAQIADCHDRGQAWVTRLGNGIGQGAEHQRGDQARHQHPVQREKIQLTLRRGLDAGDERCDGFQADFPAGASREYRQVRWDAWRVRILSGGAHARRRGRQSRRILRRAAWSATIGGPFASHDVPLRRSALHAAVVSFSHGDA